MAALRVFLSSTCYDLGDVRDQLESLCKIHGYESIANETSDILFDPRIHTHTSCVREVENADMVVIIVGGRLGGTAVPQAIALLEDGESLDLEKLEQCSISQLEVYRAIELGIPVYPFVKENVWEGRHIFRANQNSEETPRDILIPGIEKQEAAEVIFSFIDFLRLRNRNNAIVPFKKFSEISFHLQKQWSAYFQRLLDEQRSQHRAARQLDNEGFSYGDHIQVACSNLGIERITTRGSVDTQYLRPLLRKAHSIKIMFVSAETFMTAHYGDLKECISKGGSVKLLIADKGNDFANDINAIEGRPLDDPVSIEISNSVKKLKRAVREAKQDGATSFSVEYGYFSTHLRVSLVIIDDRYCHTILNYPPKRTSESLGFLFQRRERNFRGPAADLIAHFDSVFKLLKDIGKVEEFC